MFTKLVNDHEINLVDVTAITGTLAIMAEWIPTVSGLLTVAWLAMRCFVYFRDEVLKKGDKDGDERKH